MVYTSLRRIQIIILLFLVCTPINLALAGKEEEPNNTFKEAKELKDGTHNGTVIAYGGYDPDFFFIKIHRNEKIEVSILIMEGTNLQLYGYKSEMDKIDDLTISMTGMGDHGKVSWKNSEDLDKVYFMLVGNSDYKIIIKTSMNPIQGFFSDYIKEFLVLILAAIAVIIIFIISTRFFLKTINLTISHGFEERECELKKESEMKKKKIKLRDHRRSYNNMPIKKDKNGIERMMHHDDENISEEEEILNKPDRQSMDDYIKHYIESKERYQSELTQNTEYEKEDRYSTISSINKRLKMLEKENSEMESDLHKKTGKSYKEIFDDEGFDSLQDSWRNEMNAMLSD